ncbi:MAG: neutral/alkaline non-lysosomal ceramidase N-terminal domain-containing protein [Tannerella sp.]|nr:neutral/alkaline non-lysosomal ceramidase N-terminal domain-containing protein [Tannerella sp.]
MQTSSLIAGAASADITPETPHFLHGYPHVERISTGVHDRLLSSALYLTDGNERVFLIANDLLYIGKASTARIRKAVSEQTGTPESHILIAATHTHSGPVTVDGAISAGDPVVPGADPGYLRFLEHQIARAACKAFNGARPAQTGFAIADGTGTGANRRDPSFAADPQVPVLAVKDTTGNYIACMIVCSMHPTVLHEDSTLYSADFPASTREILQEKYLGSACPVLYFTGAAGNQSPRHVTGSNTFDEARRIGSLLAGSVGTRLRKGLRFHSRVEIACDGYSTDLPRRTFPPVEEAEKNRRKALEHFNALKTDSTDPKAIRTAEVDWFGAEELLFLAGQAQANALDKYCEACLPAEIQVIRIGKMTFVAWPGEIFVEYALRLKEKYAGTFLITLANGDLQGYIATEEAERNHYYEASNSLFHYSSGELLLSETFKLLDSRCHFSWESI